MKTARTKVIWAVGLAGVLMTGWFITHADSRRREEIPARPTESPVRPVADRDALVTPQEASNESWADAAPIETEAAPADETPATTASASQDNSLELDQYREWARTNTAEALTWLVNAPDGPQREVVVEIVCSELAQTAPAQAVALAGRYAGSNTNFTQSLLANLAQQWAELDMQAACAWATATPAGAEQNRLLGRIALVQSKHNPEAAARFVAEQMSPGTLQDEAALSVIYQWALRDAPAAQAWVQMFSESPLRYRAMLEVHNIQAAQKKPTSGS
jgi:hypothetical protein